MNRKLEDNSALIQPGGGRGGHSYITVTRLDSNWSFCPKPALKGLKLKRSSRFMKSGFLSSTAAAAQLPPAVNARGSPGKPPHRRAGPMIPQEPIGLGAVSTRDTSNRPLSLVLKPRPATSKRAWITHDATCVADKATERCGGKRERQRAGTCTELWKYDAAVARCGVAELEARAAIPGEQQRAAHV